jgi:hypothetical protein
MRVRSGAKSVAASTASAPEAQILSVKPSTASTSAAARLASRHLGRPSPDAWIASGANPAGLRVGRHGPTGHDRTVQHHPQGSTKDGRVLERVTVSEHEIGAVARLDAPE